MTLVLGVDLSIACTGWALVNYEDGALEETGVIRTRPSDPLSDRITHVASTVADLVAHAGAVDVYLEQPIAYRSGTGTIHLGMVHGAVLMELRRAGHPTPGYANPSAVKRFATGVGGATKELVQEAAGNVWDVSLTNDEADAAFVALFGRWQIASAVADLTEGDEPLMTVYDARRIVDNHHRQVAAAARRLPTLPADTMRLVLTAAARAVASDDVLGRLDESHDIDPVTWFRFREPAPSTTVAKHLAPAQLAVLVEHGWIVVDDFGGARWWRTAIGTIPKVAAA